MKYFGAVAACMTLALAACGDEDSSADRGEQTTGTQPAHRDAIDLPPKTESKPVKLTKPDIQPPARLPTKLVLRDLKRGIGPPSEAGDELTTEYHAVDETGKMRYSSWDKTPFQFTFELATGKYPPGLEEGLEGMQVGGRRELLIPARLTDKLGPLFYVIDLVEINRGGQCWASQAVGQADSIREGEISLACKSRIRIR